MSLINDALKKAQKQRTGEAPPLAKIPGVGGQPASQISHRRQPAGYGVPYVQIGFGVGIAVVLIVCSVYLGRFLMTDPGTRPPAKPIAVVSPAPKIEVAGAPAKPAPVAPAPFVLTVAPQFNPAPAKPATAVVSAPPVSAPLPVEVPSAVTVPEPAKPRPAGAAPKLESKAITFIEGLRVAGIRAATTDSKVLMNDRVYRVGNVVEHDLGLKLTGITADSLTFEDEHGASYTRYF